MRLPLKTRLYYSIGRHLPFLKIRPPDVDRAANLTLRPVRNGRLTWEKLESGDTILTVPQNEKVNRLVKTFARWTGAPSERRVELDEVGAHVWELCDGHHTVDSIVQLTGKQYKMHRREAEVSVTMFLQMLHERHFIGFYKKLGRQGQRSPRPVKAVKRS